MRKEDKMGLTSRLLAIRNSSFFLAALLMQFMFIVVLLLDIPIARQAFSFIYLMFVPGFVLLRLFRTSLHWLEVVLFSAGLSIAFLMIVGLLINELGLLIGVSTPLSYLSLVTVLNIIVLLLSLLASNVYEESSFQVADVIRSIVSKPLTVLYLLLPFLSVVGAVWVNTYENNSVLIFMILAICLLLVTVVLSTRLVLPKLYPLTIILVAVSLLLHRSFISNYVQSGGSDIYLELNVLLTTKNNMVWNPVLELFAESPLARYNNMLSVTVLPTFFSNITALDPVWVLKIFFPLIFSLVPLALYRLWEAQLGPKVALFSTFLFMAQQTFYTEMLGLARQMIAELFFVLLLVLMFNQKMRSSRKIILFAVFSVALIVSHYALSLIFMSLFFFTWVLLSIAKRWRARSTKITLTMIVLFSVLMFSWYIYTSNAATFESMLQFADHVYGQLGEWANPAARGTTVLVGLGLEAAPSILNFVSRGFAYIIQLLIVIGFLGVITGRLKSRLNRDYLALTSISIVLLVALILVPGLAKTLNMTRFFHILLFFLAPLCALGMELLVGFVSRRRVELATSILLLLVLIPYLLFQTNLIYEVSGSDSWSIPLSQYRMNPLRLYAHYTYIDDQSAFGASWLSERISVEYSPIYSDMQARSGALTYYGITYADAVYLETLSNVTEVKVNGTVYLNRFNVAYERIVGDYHQWNLSELTFLHNLDLVYSNGDCNIYKKP